MNTKSSMFIGLSFILLAEGCGPKPPPVEPTYRHPAIFVLSPSLKDRTGAMMKVVAWLTRHAGCEAHIFDGCDGLEICEFTVPKVDYYSEGAVAQKIGAPLQQFVAWNQKPAPSGKLAETGALALPLLLDRLAQSCPAPEWLILIGSPIHRSPADTNADFAEPRLRYPSLGHLRSAKSPFGSVGKETSLAGTRVCFLFPQENSASWPEAYEAHLRRFYGAFFASRGAALVSFTPDLDAGLRVVEGNTATALDEISLAGDLGPVRMIEESPESLLPPAIPPDASAPAAKDTRNSAVQIASSPVQQSATKSPPEVSASIPSVAVPASNSTPKDKSVSQLVVAPILNKNPAYGLPAHAKNTNEPVAAAPLPHPKPGVTISIRYKSENAAADLFVHPHPDAAELSFHNNATALGAFSCEFDLATGEQIKQVYLPAGCDPAKAEVWLNYASGFGRLAGTVVWQSPEGERRYPFSFIAVQAGDSSFKSDSRRQKSECWHRVNLFDLLTSEPSKTVLENRPIAPNSRPLRERDSSRFDNQ